MAFGDRGRYKAVATTIWELVPELDPTIKVFPTASTVEGFPSEAVAFLPMSDTFQLLWLQGKQWKWKIVAVDDEGRSVVTDDPGDGPRARELPVRWAFGGTLRFYQEWLANDDPAEHLRELNHQVSLTRTFVEDMRSRITRLMFT